MSKTNQNKKLNINNSSLYLLPQNKQKIKDPSPNTYSEKLYYNVQKRSEGIVSENKKDVYKDLVKEFADKNIDLELTNSPEVNKINNVKKLVEKIKNEIMELKRNEIKRIFKCFIENNYEEKFNTNIETVLSALIGTDAKDTEMNKYNVVKKNYISYFVS